MRNSGKSPQVTNMGELIDGIQILFGAEALTSRGQKAAAHLLTELIELRGEKGLNILRTLAKGKIDADDAHEMIYAPPY
jgi:hypothetical protein